MIRTIGGGFLGLNSNEASSLNDSTREGLPEQQKITPLSQSSSIEGTR
jgi:hypothetical protein